LEPSQIRCQTPVCNLIGALHIITANGHYSEKIIGILPKHYSFIWHSGQNLSRVNLY